MESIESWAKLGTLSGCGSRMKGENWRRSPGFGVSLTLFLFCLELVPNKETGYAIRKLHLRRLAYGYDGRPVRFLSAAFGARMPF